MRALSRAIKAGIMTGAVAAGIAVMAPAAGAATAGSPGDPLGSALSGAGKTAVGTVSTVAGTATGKAKSAGAAATGTAAAAGSSLTGTAREAGRAATKTVTRTASQTADQASGKIGAIVKTALSNGPSGVRAPYAELADAGTGLPLWSRGQDSKVPMGSITKVMTAYVVIESGNLNRLITVPKGIVAYDDKYDGSTAGLVPGEKLTAGQLLYAMLLPSGCDAAYALANAYGPGLPGFIAKMNAAASKLGLTETHFSDFSGLPDPTEHSTYSSARDLVRLGEAAMSLPTFSAVVQRSSYYLPAQAGRHPAFDWKTTNPLLGTYAGTAGIKTGNTDAAGDCLLFEAKRNGRTLIGVVLDESSFGTAAADAKRMMNWGWNTL